MKDVVLILVGIVAGVGIGMFLPERWSDWRRKP